MPTTTWKTAVKSTLEYLLNTMDVRYSNAIDCLNGLIAISQDRKVVDLLKEAIAEIEDYDDGSSVNEIIEQAIAYLTFDKMQLGWWYVKYEFAFEPMAAFGIFEEAYRQQFKDNTSETIELVNVYSDFTGNNKMPSGFIPNAIALVAGIVFQLRMNFHHINQNLGYPF